MRPIGFSTGSLAKGDFRAALQMMAHHRLQAIELSALRETELTALLTALPSLPLGEFRHISIHAPSRLKMMNEKELVALLLPFRNYPIIIHPDIITDPTLWLELDSDLLIENMDKRKPIGRTAEELRLIFEKLPQAKLCLDVGHARQVDPTMYEARQILKHHGHRLAEIHLSEVNCASGHGPLNLLAMEAFQNIAHQIPAEVPIILESPVNADLIAKEIELAHKALPCKELIPA